MAEDSAKNVVRALLNVLAGHGVKDIVCSPGSRNAPLLIAAEARKGIKKHIIIDERAAAFVALGIARVSGEPVALICTSGTALLNYAPAVAEAYHQGLPLIVVSADRPMEWIDQDDSQTIKQFEALKNIVKESYDVSDRERGDKDGWYENRIFNDAMLTALSGKRGPVHINVRISPPLNVTIPCNPEEPCRIIRQLDSESIPDKATIIEMAKKLVDKKVMLVAGFMSPDAKLNRAVARFTDHLNVTVMAETISNLHLYPEAYAVDSVFPIMSEEESLELMPDVIISIGGALVSRMLKNYLRHAAEIKPDIEHWSVGYQHTTVDCFQTLTLRVECDPAKFIGALTARLAHAQKMTREALPASVIEYGSRWKDLKWTALNRVKDIATDSSIEPQLTDLVAYDTIFESIPDSWNLYLSNGTTIRYAQILADKVPHASFCNRGVSGIEGSTATAVGGAMKYRGESILVTGDMSLCHDLGGLAAANRLESRLKIVVINNGGGAIFRFIGATSELDCREKYLCADPGIDIEKLAQAFGFKYMLATSDEELQAAMTHLTHSLSRILLEVRTSPTTSAPLLQTIFNTVK